ncbi:MAG: hypothetical protein MUE81_23635 [Thermoflexibacter sp.]|nr:hypothetical protein [Thermoflexibacter sp.]
MLLQLQFAFCANLRVFLSVRSTSKQSYEKLPLQVSKTFVNRKFPVDNPAKKIGTEVLAYAAVCIRLFGQPLLQIFSIPTIE